MKTRAALIVAALGTASSAFAQVNQPQTQGTVTWNLSYFVATPGPGNSWASGVTIAPTAGGTVGLNQAALLRLTFSLSGTPGGVDADGNPTGSPLTWNSALGGSGSGGLGGFWGGDVNVNASEATGSWSNTAATFQASVRRQILSPYSTGGGNGLVNGDPNGTGPSGAVTDIQPAQFGADAAILDHGNNLVVWRSLWIPANYNARTVNMSAALGSLGFLSQVYAVDHNYANGGNSTLPIALNVATSFGAPVGVQIIPGPSSLALLGLGGLVAARRRRA
jgi:hypothetical protein